MTRIKYFIQQSWVMMLASLLFGLTLATAQSKLGPLIAEQEQIRMNRLMQDLITEASDFNLIMEDLIVIPSEGKTLNTKVYKAKDEDGRKVGYAFTAQGPGWGGTLKLVIAVDSTFEKILGFEVLSCNETPNLGDKIGDDEFRMQFAGVSVETLEVIKIGDRSDIDNKIVAITGATFSSSYVVDIFNKHLIPVKEQLHSRGLL